jgi:hypothetical protein
MLKPFISSISDQKNHQGNISRPEHSGKVKTVWTHTSDTDEFGSKYGSLRRHRVHNFVRLNHTRIAVITLVGYPSTLWAFKRGLSFKNWGSSVLLPALGDLHLYKSVSVNKAVLMSLGTTTVSLPWLPLPRFLMDSCREAL